MAKGFLKNSFDVESSVLPESDKINPFLLKNNEAEVHKALDFIERINIPNLATDIAVKSLTNGTYYGVI